MIPNSSSRLAATGTEMRSRLFNYAETAEGEHAKLYSDAFNNLPKLKGSKAKNYYVCIVCGYTTPQLDFSKCPSCFSHKDKYEKVS